jgi:hypothetical protein
LGPDAVAGRLEADESLVVAGARDGVADTAITV